MALDPSFEGRIYPATPPYEVGREKIREFADAIGDENPVYRDIGAAQALGYPDVIAPPTFPIVMTMQAARQIVTDPELGLDYTKVVHGEQNFTYSRPIQAGDLLQVTVSVESIRSVVGNDMLTTRAEVTTVDGEHVVTALSTLVARGTAA
ncbi:FAS1-like dehydratase domain-containing protein [Jatrophihabitans sp. DSM 45814]